MSAAEHHPLDEQIASVPQYNADTPGPAAHGPRIVVGTTQTRKLPLEDQGSQRVDAVNCIDAGSGPLAQTAV